ncbi:hypothetical protein QQ045_020452 [Rhodiola kirilowii]
MAKLLLKITLCLAAIFAYSLVTSQAISRRALGSSLIVEHELQEDYDEENTNSPRHGFVRGYADKECEDVACPSFCFPRNEEGNTKTDTTKNIRNMQQLNNER